MYLYVELWKARPAWHALSKEDRVAYMAEVGPSIQKVVDNGVELLGFGVNESETPHRADYKYMAVWRIPDKNLVIELEKVVDTAGWHQYFEQVNVRGWTITPEAALNHMIHMEKSNAGKAQVPSDYDQQDTATSN